MLMSAAASTLSPTICNLTSKSQMYQESCLIASDILLTHFPKPVLNLVLLI